MLIGIAGTIGAGKSTLCEDLLSLLGESWEVLPEPVVDNPYLGLFYENPKRWAFTMQMFLLHKRYEASIIDPNKNYIQDRTLEEDRIFASLAHKQGFMTKEEYETYEGFYNTLTSSSRIRKPDRVLYLQVSLDTSLERIAKRNRAEEAVLHSTEGGRDYLNSLLEEYEALKSQWHVVNWNGQKDLSALRGLIP